MGEGGEGGGVEVGEDFEPELWGEVLEHCGVVWVWEGCGGMWSVVFKTVFWVWAIQWCNGEAAIPREE